MSVVVDFVFNDFQENTYLIYDDTKECVIIDPGNHKPHEDQEIISYIRQNELKPVRLINTHCHLDHVFGNKVIADTFDLKLEIHKGEIPVLQSTPQVCNMYGVPYPNPSPMAEVFIEEGDIIKFGNTALEVFFTPGHSPASISFYCAEDSYIIGGDVLFKQSIGRTDLPGGNFDTLIDVIKKNFLTLPDDTIVYSGHGPSTTVGDEKKSNPFLQ